MATLLAVRVSGASRFFEGLSEGDPVAWCILAAVVLFTALGAYQKYRTFSK
jgi:hypothetical protein